MKSMEDARVDVILGERLDLSSVHSQTKSGKPSKRQRTVRTETGREIAADLMVREILRCPVPFLAPRSLLKKALYF